MERYNGAYEAILSRYKGMLNELFPHRSIHTHHTLEEALLVVNKGKFKNRMHLYRECCWAYRVLYKNGMLDDLFRKSKEYTIDEALIEADNYRSIEQIRVKNRPLWNFLRKNNLFREAKPTDAMFRRVKTVDEAWAISQYYKNIADLSNHAKKAYRLLREAGLLQKRYPSSIRKVVLQYSMEGELIKEWPNAHVASQGLGMNINGAIGLVCKGKKKSAGGYIWKYKE